MERLPAEAIDACCAFLTGFDVFQLSHASSLLLRLLSADQRWLRYLPPRRHSRDVDANSPEVSVLKREYMASRSLHFGGRPVGLGHVKQPGPFMPVHHTLMRANNFRTTSAFTWDFRLGHSQCLTIDTWFSLLPGDNEVCAGGVLFGGQASYAGTTESPLYRNQFIMVDSQLSLYCSLLNRQNFVYEPVMTGLSVGRWYHLALTYDKATCAEQVFLDGDLVASGVGDWHPGWRRFECAQIGTGYVAAGLYRLPKPHYGGWYAFHGIVDEFRVWQCTLSAEDVKLIASNTSLPPDSLVWFAMSRGDSFDQYSRQPERVPCTRPRELLCMRP